MARRYENYNSGDEDFLSVYSAMWRAQTFKTGGAHYITSVKIKVFRSTAVFSVGTVRIKAVDVDEEEDVGYPTGADLTSGTFDASALTTDEAGEWITVPVTKYKLEANTRYALVVSLKAAG